MRIDIIDIMILSIFKKVEIYSEMTNDKDPVIPKTMNTITN